MTRLRTPRVIVIGAGMTGILLAIKLKEAGITDVTVFEKANKIGGTWRDNTYPGVACDVPSHMYTYSFEPNPRWSNLFAKGDEIQAYFEHVVAKYKVEQYIRFGEAVTGARLDGHTWNVTTPKGKYQADFVISATGILHHPSFPDIDGIDLFKGHTFHTARWDSSVKIDSNTKVGVIGTGSTAAQAIPELVDTDASVSVFQRTPQWVLPIPNMPISERTKNKLARSPKIVSALRRASIAFMEHVFTKAVTGHFLQKKLLSFLCKLNLLISVRDRPLRASLTPDYQVGCKRVIVNNTFYKAIKKPNAHLINTGIKKIGEKGVITQDGKLHELDVLVLATGFKPLNYMRPMDLIGKNGLHIDDAWADSIDVYRSLLIKNFPNFLLMLGPNTPIGNFSVIAMSEVQTNYILQLIDKWRHNEFDLVEPKNQAVIDFNDYIKDGLSKTAWVGGCQSWYLDAQGKPILWPYTWSRWESEMKSPRMHDLELT